MMPPRDEISKLSNARFLTLIREVSPAARRRLILERAAANPEFFARRFLAHYTRLPFAHFHRELFRWHIEMGEAPLAEREGRRFAVAAPRGSAKSTIVSLVLLLHDIVFRREAFIVLISATERQARQRLRSLRAELERGELAALVPGATLNARELLANDVRVEAYGAGSEMRGIAQRAWRPTKIVLDDAESSASAASPRRRAQLHDWFREIVEHLGDRFTHLLAIGTVLHPQSLLATLLERPDFTSLRLRSIESFSNATALWEQWRRRLVALDDPERRATARAFFDANRAAMLAGTRVLWPQKEDYEELMVQLTLQGRRAFYQEKQNSPLGPEDSLFSAHCALRAQWDGKDLVVVASPECGGGEVRGIRDASQAPRFAYLDPALGKSRDRGTGDFSALAVVRRLPDGTLFLESLRARRIAPTAQIAEIFDMHAIAPIERLAIEAVAFQELLLIPFEEERRRRRAAGKRADLAVEASRPTASKATRIATLEPLLANGALVLAPNLDEEFWEELGSYPRCAHDDALDATAGAVELARNSAGAPNAAPLARPRHTARSRSF